MSIENMVALLADAINKLGSLTTPLSIARLRKNLPDDRLKENLQEAISRWASSIPTLSRGPPGSDIGRARTLLLELSTEIGEIDFESSGAVIHLCKTARDVLACLGFTATEEEWMAATSGGTDHPGK